MGTISTFFSLPISTILIYSYLRFFTNTFRTISLVHFRMLQLTFRYLPQVDAILISHLDITHIGALPALLKNIPPNCRIYATVPVFQMGQHTLRDQFKVSVK